MHVDNDKDVSAHHIHPYVICRWKEASELSMFPSNSPLIQVKIEQSDIDAVSTSLQHCRYADCA